MDEDYFDFEEGQELQPIEEIMAHFEQLLTGNNCDLLPEMSFERLIDYYDEEQNLQKALEVAKLGCNYYPFSAELLIKNADLLIADRKYKEALVLLEQAQMLNKMDINIYILQVDALLGLNDYETANQVFLESLDYFELEDKIDLLSEYVDVFDDYEAYESVFDCLKRLLEIEPNDEMALYKICYWTEFTGQFEASIKIHQKIIEDNPYNELAWFNLAAAFQGLKLYEKAIDAYEYAIVINEKFDIAYRNLGDTYMRLRKYKKAIEALEKVIELTHPEDVLYEAIGHCYHKMENYVLARLNYRKASYLQPQDSKLYYKIALTHIDEKKWNDAIKSLEIAMRISTAPEFHLAIGECLMQLEKQNEAIYHFGIVVKMRPKNAPGWESLIKCLYLSGFYAEAEQQSGLALEATSNKPIFYFYKTVALFAQNNMKEGLIQLEIGMHLAPRQFRKIVELHPGLMQNSKVVDILAKHHKSRH